MFLSRWLTQKEGKEDGRAEVQGPNWLSLFRLSEGEGPSVDVLYGGPLCWAFLGQLCPKMRWQH